MSKKKYSTTELRAIGHNLKPVVIIASKGLNDNVLTEIQRALSDHELIKIKVAVGDRARKQAVIAELCESVGAELVQSIGHIALLLRHAPKPNPQLSNLQRPVR